MRERQNILINRLKQIIPDFRFADRLRRETFDSATRQQRMRVMGSITKYCEVLHVGPGDERQEDSLGMTVLDSDQFRVNLWYHYNDTDDYETSSEKEFNDICFEENGILRTLQTEPEDAYPGMIWNITNVEKLVVSLDNEGTELAHFLTFLITLR